MQIIASSEAVLAIILAVVALFVHSTPAVFSEPTRPINNVDWFKLRACQYGNMPGTWTQLPEVSDNIIHIDCLHNARNACMKAYLNVYLRLNLDPYMTYYDMHTHVHTYLSI